MTFKMFKCVNYCRPGKCRPEVMKIHEEPGINLPFADKEIELLQLKEYREVEKVCGGCIYYKKKE